MAATKVAAEDEAMESLASSLDPPLGEELLALFSEYRDRQTPEARFVKQVDILETLMQSREYLADHPDLPMESFALESEQEIEDRYLVVIREAVLSMDPTREGGLQKPTSR